MFRLVDLLLSSSPKVWVFAILPLSYLVYWVGWAVYARTLHPLASVPGPFWPSISRTWLMYRMYCGDLELRQRELHDQYGPLIRTAPDEVVTCDPDAVPLIYPVQKPLQKTNWYHVWRAVPALSKRPDMFTGTDEKEHAAYRRIVGGVYSMTNILRNEPQLDGCLNLFLERLGGFADRNEDFDFGLWLEMYAFDVVGAVFFGKQFGFLEHSHDHDRWIESVHLAMPFLSVITMAPVYARHPLLTIAVVIPKLLKSVIAVDGLRRVSIKETQNRMKESEASTSNRHDILSQLLTIVNEKGDKVDLTHNEATSEMWTGIMAGADSTSIALRAIFYYMMKNPHTLAKARAEVDAAFADGRLTSPVRHTDAITLPYLCAVVKEATRMFPSFQVPMPRYAPAQGLQLSGRHIPAGYRVGMNPKCVQYDKNVFGHDADVFHPERWLESEERNKAMEKACITFGAGTRTCTGKHLAMAEIHKIVPEILHRFDFKMAHDRPWKTHNATFNMQSDVICRFTRRTAV